MKSILDYCRRRWFVVLIITVLIVGNLYVWVPIFSITLSHNIKTEVNPMLEIIKIFASGIVTFFAVWIGARLSQNTQMKHLMAQNITASNEKWKEEFKHNVSLLISHLKETYVINKQMGAKVDNSIDTEEDLDKFEKFRNEVQPEVNRLYTQIKLSLDEKDERHKKLLFAISGIINDITKSDFAKDYLSDKNNNDMFSVISLSSQIIQNRDKETSIQIKNLF